MRYRSMMTSGLTALLLAAGLGGVADSSASAQSGMTITATNDARLCDGVTVKTLVLDGAATTGGASADGSHTGAPSFSLTPAGSNSLPVFALYDGNGGSSGEYTAETGNTLLDNRTQYHAFGDGYYSGTVTASKPITLGSSTPTRDAQLWSAYEIPPSGSSSPTIDSSTPAVANSGNSACSATTASFTPPSGAVVALLVTANARPGQSATVAISDTGGLTFTQHVSESVRSEGYSAIYTATATSSEICVQQMQSASLDGGLYYLQSNEYNSSAPFEACSDGNVDFTIAQSGINVATDGAPGGYPSLYRGNHWGTITQDSGLPVQVSTLENGGVVTSKVSTTTITSGVWDDAYDTFFEPTATDNQNDAGTVEMMIWLTHNGSVQPAGSIVASNVTIAGTAYNIWWSGSTLTFDAVNAETSADIDFGPFAAYAVKSGYITSSMYFSDVEHGFEIWSGGQGLEDNSFQVCTPAGC
jgi:Glycosyl hydrolase family 12